MNIFKEFSISLLSLNRYLKRLIAIITDLGLCVLCTWLAFTLRLEELILFQDFNFKPAIISELLQFLFFDLWVI